MTPERAFCEAVLTVTKDPKEIACLTAAHNVAMENRDPLITALRSLIQQAVDAQADPEGIAQREFLIAAERAGYASKHYTKGHSW